MITPIILSGGAGARLWPASRENLPKQFLPLLGDETPFASAIARAADAAQFAEPIIITNAEHRFHVAEAVRASGARATILLEPDRRDSAMAIASAIAYVAGRDPAALVLVLPADHVIRDVDAFRADVASATRAAEVGRIVTFGATPGGPVTEFGYIGPGAPFAELPGVATVSRFVEKPDRTMAEDLIKTGHLWNCGIFLMRAELGFAEIRRHAPAVAAAAEGAVARLARDLDFLRLASDSFRAAPCISFDRAVMEKTDRAVVVQANFDWSDIGNWESIWRSSDKDQACNATIGDVVLVDVKSSYISAGRQLFSLIGVNDLIVVASDDAVLIADRRRSAEVKNLVEKLKAERRGEVVDHAQSHRPWGYYRTIDAGPRYQVKRIVVKPGGRLSLQKHFHRSEHWVVVTGTALVTIDETTKTIGENESVYVPRGSVHRLENPGLIPLELIEVQSGSYLGEDDIVRLDDVYNRVGSEFQR